MRSCLTFCRLSGVDCGVRSASPAKTRDGIRNVKMAGRDFTRPRSDPGDPGAYRLSHLPQMKVLQRRILIGAHDGDHRALDFLVDQTGAFPPRLAEAFVQLRRTALGCGVVCSSRPCLDPPWRSTSDRQGKCHIFRQSSIDCQTIVNDVFAVARKFASTGRLPPTRANGVRALRPPVQCDRPPRGWRHRRLQP